MTNNTINSNNDDGNNDILTNSYNIKTGNITGKGIIVGNNNHIDGNIIIDVSEKSNKFGFTLLSPKYFIDNISYTIFHKFCQFHR